MTRNNVLFKILFAIEIAMLPMLIFAHLYLPSWSISLFIVGILVAKNWLHALNDKTKASTVIISIGNILVFSVIITLLIIVGYISKPLAIVALVFIVLANVFNITLHGKALNETIEAVDFCYTLFEILTMVAFVFMTLALFDFASVVGLFALILTGAVSVAYKAYYTIRYTDIVSKIKKLFKRN